MTHHPWILALVYGFLFVFVCVSILLGVAFFGMLVFGIVAHGAGNLTVNMTG